jgi:hypothetical protein
VDWKTHNGISVAVDDSGDFCAEVGGIFLRDSSWERLKVKIEQESKAEAKANYVELECVALVCDEDGNYKAALLMLVGLNRRDSTFKWEEKLDNRKVRVVLPRNAKTVQLLEQLAIAKSTVRDIEEAIKPHTIHPISWGGRIEPTKYNEELKNLKERYDIAVKGKAT